MKTLIVFMVYNACSIHNDILGCVGCIDGYLVHICAPNDEEVSNVHAYFSGRYKKFGINIQCVCDSMCRFLYVSVSIFMHLYQHVFLSI